MKKGLLALVAFLVVFTGALVVRAAAADRTFAYRGRLENNGQGVTGNVAMTIRFFNAPTGGAQIGPDLTFSSVPVAAGEFAVDVGPLTDAQMDANPAYLEITVNGVRLGGRQRVSAVPYAMRGRFDGAFVIDGPGRLRGALVVEGSDLVLGTNDGRSAGSRTTQRALVHDAADTLVVNYAGDFEGGVRFDSPMTVNNGSVTVGQDVGTGTTRAIAFGRDSGDDGNAGKIAYKGSFGATELHIVGAGPYPGRRVRIYDNVKIEGNLENTPTCRNVSTACDQIGNGNVIYLDRQNVACSDNEALVRWRVQACSDPSLMRVDYRCCDL